MALLFDDIFEVLEKDPDGKVFDKGSSHTCSKNSEVFSGTLLCTATMTVH